MEAWGDLYQALDSALDEAGDITILGVPYQRSRILKLVDLPSYRQAANDLADARGVDTDDLAGSPL